MKILSRFILLFIATEFCTRSRFLCAKFHNNLIYYKQVYN